MDHYRRSYCGSELHEFGYPRYRYRKPYGFFAFCGDVFMTFLTGGLWLIWIFVREMRNR